MQTPGLSRKEKNHDRKVGNPESSSTPPTTLIRAELQKILDSPIFGRAPRLSKFLRVTVEYTLDGQAEKIKEYTIGVEVFERGPSYDPHVDAIVRIEAGRLRKKLKTYYETLGRDSSVQIQLRPGSYVPTFVERPCSISQPEPESLRNRYLPAGWNPLLVAAALVTGALIQWQGASLLHRLSSLPKVVEAGALSGRTNQNLPANRPFPYDLQIAQQQPARVIREGAGSPVWELGLPLRGQETRDTSDYQAPGRLLQSESYSFRELMGIGLDRIWQIYQSPDNREQVSYALAYLELANSFSAFATIESLPPSEAMPRARAAAVRALQIDPALAGAHASLGFIMCVYDWDCNGADLEFKRAIELNPTANTHFWYSLACLQSRGHIREALSHIHQALRFSPRSVDFNAAYAGLLLRSGRYDQAIAQCRKTLALAPNDANAYRDLGFALQEKSQIAAAILAQKKAVSLSHDDPPMLAGLGYIYAVSGKREEAQQVLDELTQMAERRYVSPYHLAAIYAGLAQTNRTFELLNQALKEHSIWLNGVKVDPVFASLHDDPRFNTLVRKMKLDN